MSVLDGLKGHYQAGGLRGVAAITAHRLLGRPNEISIHPPGLRAPVFIRLRTSDLSVYDGILLRREYEFEIPFSPETVVDVGANIGMASIYFTNRFPAARVIAVEAEASNYEVLVKNVAPYPNIHPVHAALWDKDGEVSVCSPDPTSKAFDKWGFVTREGFGVRVRAMTMQTLLAENRLSSIDLLKVDIEGAEKDVFGGCCDWVQSVRCLMIELHDHLRPGCSAAVHPMMEGCTTTMRGETTMYIRQ
jgi:FkbM family methyltransferase